MTTTLPSPSFLDRLRAEARSHVVMEGRVAFKESRAHLPEITSYRFIQVDTPCVVLVVETPSSAAPVNSPAAAVSAELEARARQRVEVIRTARKAHYDKILPSAERQQELMADLLSSREAAEAQPGSRSARLAAEQQSIAIFNAFRMYIQKAIHGCSDSAPVSVSAKEDMRTEMWSVAKVKLFDCVNRWTPGSPEISRLFSKTLKYALLDVVRAKVAECSDSAARTLHTPPKSFREIVSYSAARKSGEEAVESLKQRRNWSEKKMESLEQNYQLLGSVVRLDASLDQDDESGDSFADTLADANALSADSICSREDLRVQLQSGIREGLTPMERLVLSVKFKRRFISPAEAKHKIRHAKTGLAIDTRWMSADRVNPQAFVDAVGMSPEVLRQTALRAERALAAVLKNAGVDETMCNEDLTAGVWS